MKLELNNIGLIKNSEIQIDGLTVITGNNNSGKTTVGKVLFSLVDAVSDLGIKARNDKLKYIETVLWRLADEMRLFRIPRLELEQDEIEPYGKYESLGKLFENKHGFQMDLDANINFLLELLDELNEMDVAQYREELMNRQKEDGLDYDRYFFRTNSQEEMDEQRAQGIEYIEKVLERLAKDPELIDYARESINQTLNKEFANQIQPVAHRVNESKITMSGSDRTYYNITIKDNKLFDNKMATYTGIPFKDVYLIDDPFIIDQGLLWDSTIRFGRRMRFEETDNAIIDKPGIVTHSVKLRKLLFEETDTSVFEQTLIDDDLKVIRERIDTIIPGKIEISRSNKGIIMGDTKLRLENLATGSKVFAILKMLMERGKIGKDTLLIFDEPESHLHPQWQNIFAEIIVLLVKTLSMKVVLTTHSPNFMLAIDAYMREYDISNVTNFYQTKQNVDGTVDYTCVNNNMESIYESFVKSLSEVKELRDMYLIRERDEDDG